MKKIKQSLVFAFFMSFLLHSVTCQQAQLWMSQPGKGLMLIQQSNLNFIADKSTTSNTISVNPSVKYQEIDGFGGSLTGASTWLMKYKLSSSKQKEVLNSLFASTGINLSLLRQPIGACDFNTEAWTYDDVSGSSAMDYNLKNFSLAREDDYIKPVLQSALAVNSGRIKLIGSPWSPPAWMKSSRNLFGAQGGTLRKDSYDAYANYFVKYIQEYAKTGKTVYAITVQNEPQYAPWSYPGMLMSSSEQIDFIANYLGPKFQKLGIKTKIISFDHNYDDAGVAYAYDVLKNSSSYQYIAGTGFHTYTSPSHERMTEVTNAYPSKGVWITEAGSGTWIGSGTDTGMFQDQMMHMIRSTRNYARGVIFWNIALDQNAGPNMVTPGTPGSNRGFVTIRSDKNDTVKFEMSYYSMGHTSKFVDPGARRIDSNWSKDDLENVAYQNPDSSIVVVVSNRVATDKQVKIIWNSKSVSFTLPATSAATIKWKPV